MEEARPNNESSVKKIEYLRYTNLTETVISPSTRGKWLGFNRKASTEKGVNCEKDLNLTRVPPTPFYYNNLDVKTRMLSRN
jgi:hypothetical protein